jgi:hypothetical protein
VEGNDEFRDVVAARIVASDDDLWVVFDAAGIIALTRFENGWNLRLAELRQSSEGKGEDLDGRNED